MNGCCESKSWALSERDLNKVIMKEATMRCVLSRSVASKTDTEGCISFTCIANQLLGVRPVGLLGIAKILPTTKSSKKIQF